MSLGNKLLKKINVYALKFSDYWKKHYYFQYFVLSALVMFISEIFSQRSVFSALDFFIHSFPTFMVGYSVVFLSLLLIHFLKKRNFWKYAISGMWVLLSVINFIMYTFRLMPFSFNDILLIPSTFTVIPKYLSVFQMILICCIIIALVAGIVWLYRKTANIKINFKKDIAFALVLLIFAISYLTLSSYTNIIDKRVLGLINKYERNGFIYCYASSIFERGMSEPDSYSVSEVSSIIKNLDKKANDDIEKPNIIFLQLESFFDVNNVKELKYSENPIPVFNSLEEKFSHGYLTVPTFSAGTANTEFEVLTGLNVGFLGIGEVAYQTVVPKGPIETVCHHLKRIGYTAHAIHNNYGTFYNRNIIYSNLGFDTFTSLEYMYDVEYNALGWARDKVIATSIIDCLKSDKSRDFIYAVGVQTHGTYPNNVKDSAKLIDVTGFGDNEEIEESYEYYISQMKEVDTFIGDLISEIEKINEPSVLVIFGDHMPGFDVEDNQLVNDSKYQTEYVIWSNFDTDCVIKDLYSYQLYSYVLDRVGIDGGVISKLNEKYSFSVTDDYMDNYEVIQYDMLEGEGLSYGSSPPQKTGTKMGIRQIKLTGVNSKGNTVEVRGSEFTQCSSICINDKLIETKYVNSKALLAEDYLLKSGDIVTVCQVDDKSNILSKTNSLEYK